MTAPNEQTAQAEQADTLAEILNEAEAFPHLHFQIPYGKKSILRESDDDLVPFYKVEVALNIGDPVHETITQEALRRCGRLSAQQTYSSPESWEYTRGAFWNDDPECLLFDGSDGVGNYSLAGAVRFLKKFKAAERQAKVERAVFAAQSELLARSHFGDLQFLHAMAASDGEAPAQTLAWIVEWAEFTYAVARRPELGSTPIREVTEGGIGRRFPNDPRTVSQLFGIRGQGRVGERAIASLLHLIQDSHSPGHTQRHSDGYVQEFHSYTNQDAVLHASADKFVKGSLAETPGALRAVQCCTDVLQILSRNAPWQDLLQYLKESVFELSPVASPASPGAAFMPSS